MLLDMYFVKLASDRPKARPMGILPPAPPKFAAGLRQVHGSVVPKPLLVFSRREGGSNRAAQPAPSMKRMILDDYLTNKIQGEKGGIKQHSEQVVKPSLCRRIHMILDDYLDNNSIGGEGEAKKHSERAASPTPFRRIGMILDEYIFEKNAGLGFIGNRAFA